MQIFRISILLLFIYSCTATVNIPEYDKSSQFSGRIEKVYYALEIRPLV